MKIREKISDFITDHSYQIIGGSIVVLSACYGIYVGRTIERRLYTIGWMKLLEVDPELYPRVMDAERKALSK